MVGIGLILAVLILAVLAGLVVIDEGRKDLRAGVDGHPKIIAGVCIVSISGILIAALTVMALE